MKEIKIKSCHACPYLNLTWYFDTERDWNEHDENEKTLALCGYALRNIRLTLKEANQIPEWCPLEDSGA